MPIKDSSYYRGKQPKQVRDIFEFVSIDGNGVKWEIDTYLFYRAWGNNLNEYEQALVNLLCETISHRSRIFNTIDNISLLSATIWDKFGLRKIFKTYYENYTYWDGVISDFSYLQSLIEGDILECIKCNRYKWGNLMKSCLLEFNPLWNVDGTEETTRTLEQDGTITNRKRGSDSEDEDITTTISSTETDTMRKTGTDTTAKSGNDAVARTGNERTITDESTSESHRGTVNRDIDSDNLTTNNLSDLTTYAGMERDSHQSHTTAIESKTTTESETLYTASKVENTGAGNDNYDLKEFTNRTDTVAKTGTVREQIDSTEGETRNLTDTTEHDNDVTTTHNTTDTTSYNSSDTTTYNTTDTGNHGLNESNVVDRSNVLTHNTDDTETRDLLDTERITHRRTGNIGITTTTKLLDEFRAYSRFDIVEIVAHDITNVIAEGVY